jgi:hypothetical protein
MNWDAFENKEQNILLRPSAIRERAGFNAQTTGYTPSLNSRVCNGKREGRPARALREQMVCRL